MSSETTLKPKKRNRPSTSAIEDAVAEVINCGQSINKTAIAFKISRAYLAKIVKKARNSAENAYVHCPDIGNKRIFTILQENLLVSYLKTASKMCHGLTRHQTRELAFQYAQANSVCPDKWNDNQTASVDWLRGFMSRHKDLAIRKPESTSLSRATSFNRTNVAAFFEKLTSLYEKYKFPAHMIYNTDETGCSTVTTPPKIIAARGSKQIGQVTSAERGTLITTLFFINAAGGSIPPTFIFPRVNFKNDMLTNGPTGALGLAHLSGWMTEESFVLAMEHFVKHVSPTKENPALILMDNHSSHVNLRVIEFAREKSVIILTFPPHCSHKLQPLDVAVYGPFKTRYRIAMNEWMLSNPGKTVTIYQVGQFVRDAYLAAFSLQNVTQGFVRTGIYPLNSNIFSDDEFLCSYVTDRPYPSSEIQPNPLTESEVLDNNTIQDLERSTAPQPSTSQQNLISPEVIRPFLKAGPRKNLKHSNRKMSSAIITDSAEKKIIEEKGKKMKSKRAKVQKMATKKNIRKLNKRSEKNEESDSTSENGTNISLHDESSIATSEEEILLQIKKRQKDNSSRKIKDICKVCNGSYAISKEEWYKCKICDGWAHESCGVKGKLNYFCQRCF